MPKISYPEIRCTLSSRVSKKSKESVIVARLRISPVDIMYSTGRTIAKSKWSSRGGEPKKVGGNAAQSAKDQMTSIANDQKKVTHAMYAAYDYMIGQYGHLPSLKDSEAVKDYNKWFTALFKDRCDKLLKRGAKQLPLDTSFTSFIESFISKHEEGSTRATSTVIKYRSARNSIYQWAHDRNAGMLNYSDISEEFLVLFTEYLYSPCSTSLQKINIKVNQKEYRISSRGGEASCTTAKKIVGVLKVFMKQARKFHDNNDYEEFKVQKTKKLKYWLNEDEINALYNLKLTGVRERIRDAFVLACETGMRISEVYNFNNAWIRMEGPRETWRLKVHHTKTDNIAEPPLRDRAVAILKKYGNKSPMHQDAKFQGLVVQKFNPHLTELCKMAGIDSLEIKRSYTGTQKRDIQMPKYKLITSHSARITFITNMARKGIPADVIRRWSGHSSVRQLEEYDLATAEDMSANLIKMALL